MKLPRLNRVVKWRAVFAGWQLGTRLNGDPEGDALRNHRETTIILNVEMNALAGLLLQHGVIDTQEWEAAVEEQARLLDETYERQFPGFRAADAGVEMYDPVKAAETMARWTP